MYNNGIAQEKDVSVFREIACYMICHLIVIMCGAWHCWRRYNIIIVSVSPKGSYALILSTSKLMW